MKELVDIRDNIQRNESWGNLVPIFRDHPFITRMKEQNIPFHLEKYPAIIDAGDVFIHFWSHPRIEVATGVMLGGKNMFYDGGQDSFPTPFLGDHMTYRIGRGLSIEIPARKTLLAEEIFHRHGPYLNEYIKYSLETLPKLVISESFHQVKDREYNLRIINDISQIEFSDEYGMMKEDYLYITKKGKPVIFSDFHQKLPAHIGQLISQGYLSNIKPIIDWLDAHDDEELDVAYVDHRIPVREIIRQPVKNLEDIIRGCCRMDCGQVTSYMDRARLADFRFFDNLSMTRMPGWGEHVDPFKYSNPFARQKGTRPRLLSFDLDQLLEFVGARGMSPKFLFYEHQLANYFSWLSESGMNSDSYDAVFVYTSPGYFYTQLAIQAIPKIVEMLER